MIVRRISIFASRLTKFPPTHWAIGSLGLRANRLLRKIEKTEPVDIVWRMHPYEGSSPIVPYTNGRPLVIGPLFLGWPKESVPANDMGKPRFGIGIRGLLKPFAQRGWDRAVRKAALVICATESLSEETRNQTDGAVLTLPVIVEPPPNLISLRGPKGMLKLLFAANLYRNKNPIVFCETIHRLRKMGVSVVGEIVGDGPERAAMEQWCQSNALRDAVRFLGRIPNSDVYQHLADADGLVSTSFGGAVWQKHCRGDERGCSPHLPSQRRAGGFHQQWHRRLARQPRRCNRLCRCDRSCVE